jgi:hypothetical protein
MHEYYYGVQINPFHHKQKRGSALPCTSRIDCLDLRGRGLPTAGRRADRVLPPAAEHPGADQPADGRVGRGGRRLRHIRARSALVLAATLPAAAFRLCVGAGVTASIRLSDPKALHSQACRPTLRPPCSASPAARLGLGRIIALHHRLPTSYQIF